jgi:Protein of unknown function (DUF2997)
MKQVIIEVDAEGNIKVEASGFKGADCEKATKALEAALGAQQGDRKRKPEFFQATGTGNIQRA